MKKIAFLTGTRADYGKLKSVMRIISEQKQDFQCYIFVTGMHMLSQYGSTYEDVIAGEYGKYFTYINQNYNDSMDTVLAKTISGFSDFVKEIQPDMIVVHGDRVEAMAGALVGSLNNILVSHIEGGEVSGTVDELIRHAISKLSHIHYVSNEAAKNRLVQLGEMPEHIYIVGSPDIDVMISKNLPTVDDVKQRYDIQFEQYSVVMFHPVTTETEYMAQYTANMVDALIASNKNYVVIYPNNDAGSSSILETYKKIEHHPNFRLFPSMRFEYFLTLLKNAQMMVGNSSAGVREAPFYGLPSVNVGTRQNNRSYSDSIVHCSYETKAILSAINEAAKHERHPIDYCFGKGRSDEMILSTLEDQKVWQTPKQKYFNDIAFSVKERTHAHDCTN